jgi:hypothetical protein
LHIKPLGVLADTGKIVGNIENTIPALDWNIYPLWQDEGTQSGYRASGKGDSWLIRICRCLRIGTGLRPSALVQTKSPNYAQKFIEH